MKQTVGKLEAVAQPARHRDRSRKTPAAGGPKYGLTAMKLGTFQIAGEKLALRAEWVRGQDVILKALCS